MDDAPSLADRREQQKHARRLVGIGGGILAVAVIAIVVLLLAGGGDDTKQGAEDTTVAPATNVSLQLGNVSTESAGPPAQLTSEQANAVLKVVTDYVDTATVDPLRT